MHFQKLYSSTADKSTFYALAVFIETLPASRKKECYGAF